MQTFEELCAEIDKLDLTGRDNFHTHLIQQEIPFWVNEIYSDGAVDMKKAAQLAKGRGFNLSEKRKFFKLARWLNEHAAELRRSRPAESKHHWHMHGWLDGAKGLSPDRKDPAYLSGHAAGKKAQRLASKRFARQIGYEIPRKPRVRKAEGAALPMG